MKNQAEKHIYVIAGSNGAGKTTFAREFLPHYAHCLRFINPDLIAAGLSPFDPRAAAGQAGKLVLLDLFNLYAPEMDSVHFFDNSGTEPRLVFRLENGRTTILDQPIYTLIKRQVGR